MSEDGRGSEADGEDDAEADWFERALREEPNPAAEAPDEADGEATSGGAARDETSDGETEDGEPSDEPVADDPTDVEQADTADADTAAAADEAPDAGSNGEADPFGGVSDDATTTADGDEADPFGGTSDDPFGGMSDDPFGDDFSAAMGSAPGGAPPDASAGSEFDEFDGFGGGRDGEFGGFGGSGSGFDEAEFDSDIDRIDVGIEGLDEMILGGVPDRSLMTVIGSAGTGKTTFGLQFLNEALTNGGDAVYVTLEESRDAILSTAEEKGWEYRRYEEEDRLAVVAMDPVEMANSLDSIRDDISRLVAEFGADRLVLDSVSLLEMMYDHPSKRRSEVFDFARSLKEAGVTTMLTSEAADDNPYASRHGIVEYLTDAVFVLQYVRASDFRETRLAVEIQKIRDANHSRETKPYEITDDGISVYRQANIF